METITTPQYMQFNKIYKCLPFIGWFYNFIIIIIIKLIYRAHFCGMPQMRWRQQLHVK